MYRITEIEEVDIDEFVVRGSAHTGWTSNREPRYENVVATVLSGSKSYLEVSIDGTRRESDDAYVDNPEFSHAAEVAVWAYRLGFSDAA